MIVGRKRLSACEKNVAAFSCCSTGHICGLCSCKCKKVNGWEALELREIQRKAHSKYTNLLEVKYGSSIYRSLG